MRTKFLSLACAVLGMMPHGLFAANYGQHNLISNIPGMADRTDANLVNAWGIVHSATSPWWVNDNGTGVSEVFNGAGQAFPLASPIVVKVPPVLVIEKEKVVVVEKERPPVVVTTTETRTLTLPQDTTTIVVTQPVTTGP